jgi:hypothetical protein
VKLRVWLSYKHKEGKRRLWRKNQFKESKDKAFDFLAKNTRIECA